MRNTPLARYTPLARGGSEIARSGPPKRRKRLRRKRRSAEEFGRVYGGPERVWFFHHCLRCAVCGAEPEVAHLGNEGLGRKSHHTLTVPLCSTHHILGADSLHVLGPKRFEKRHDLRLRLIARRAQEAFEGPAGQAMIALAKEDGSYERWLRRAA